MQHRRSIRPWQWAVGGLAAILLLLLLSAATIDVDRFRHVVERRLTQKLGQRVTIGRLSREQAFSLSPTIRVDALRVAQPDWVPRDRPPMVMLDRLRFRLHLLPWLVGVTQVDDVEIAGGQLALIRDRSGRANWPQGGKSGPSFASVSFRRFKVSLDDRKRDRSALVTADADPRNGVHLAGTGTVRGSRVTIVALYRPSGRFAARVEGSALRTWIAGQTEGSGGIGAFTARVVASGHDLRDLDALAEAGLPGTQPFHLTATLRHAQPDWFVTDLTGVVGRSTIDGAVAIHRKDSRTRLEGKLHAAALDLDDLASDEGLARAAAKQRAIGPRLVPDTRIALDHFQQTDGILDFRIDRLLWKKPAPFSAARGRFTADHGTLTLAPLIVDMTQGRITGSMRVTQHGADTPTRMALDLRMTDATIDELAGKGAISAPLRGRVSLVGVGPTLRQAAGTGSGRIALVAGAGTLDHRAAELIGRNVGRALKAKAGERVPLRCMVIDFRGRAGRFAAQPFLIDSAVARADGRGTLSLPDEALALTVSGGSKVPAAFRLSGPLQIGGTLKAPAVKPSPAAVSAGGLLKSVGRAILGKTEPAAPDADCAALSARALR